MVDETRTALSDNEIGYYYTGFLRVLRRYRTMTTLGWVIVLAGFVSLFIGWNLGFPHGLIDLALSSLSILSGILVVQQAVAALQEFVSIPYPSQQSEHAALTEVRKLMEDIQRGGWREARGATGQLEKLADKHKISGPLSTDLSQPFQER